MSSQLVTAVIPCFNHGRFIAECIASLERQTHASWKAIIIDDASTDGETPALCDAVKSERVTVVHLSVNKGRAGARNVGIEMAKSEAIMSLDADDELAPEHFARTIPLLFADPRCGVVYTDYEHFGGRTGIMRGKPFDVKLLYVVQYIYAGSLFRKSAFAKTAGYRTEFNIGNEDWDFWLSIVETGFFGTYVAEPLYRYRHHAGSWSSQSPASRAKVERTSRELLRERHREGYERSGQLARFDRDTELNEAKLLLNGGEARLARHSALRAMRLDPVSFEPWRLLLRSMLPRVAPSRKS